MELNEHVQYECGAEEELAELLYRLSTPEINEPITRSLVQKLRKDLADAHQGSSEQELDPPGPNRKPPAN